MKLLTPGQVIKQSMPINDPSHKAQLLVSRREFWAEHDNVLFVVHEGKRAVAELRAYDFETYETMRCDDV